MVFVSPFSRQYTLDEPELVGGAKTGKQQRNGGSLRYIPMEIYDEGEEEDDEEKEKDTSGGENNDQDQDADADDQDDLVLHPEINANKVALQAIFHTLPIERMRTFAITAMNKIHHQRLEREKLLMKLQSYQTKTKMMSSSNRNKKSKSTGSSSTSSSSSGSSRSSRSSRKKKNTRQDNNNNNKDRLLFFEDDDMSSQGGDGEFELRCLKEYLKHVQEKPTNRGKTIRISRDFEIVKQECQKFLAHARNKLKLEFCSLIELELMACQWKLSSLFLQAIAQIASDLVHVNRVRYFSGEKRGIYHPKIHGTDEVLASAILLELMADYPDLWDNTGFSDPKNFDSFAEVYLCHHQDTVTAGQIRAIPGLLVHQQQAEQAQLLANSNDKYIPDTTIPLTPEREFLDHVKPQVLYLLGTIFQHVWEMHVQNVWDEHVGTLRNEQQQQQQRTLQTVVEEEEGSECSGRYHTSIRMLKQAMTRPEGIPSSSTGFTTTCNDMEERIQQQVTEEFQEKAKKKKVETFAACRMIDELLECREQLLNDHNHDKIHKDYTRSVAGSSSSLGDSNCNDLDDKVGTLEENNLLQCKLERNEKHRQQNQRGEKKRSKSKKKQEPPVNDDELHQEEQVEPEEYRIFWKDYYNKLLYKKGLVTDRPRRLAY